MKKKRVAIIGVPSDLGANMRGANMGPAAIRIAHLHEKLAALGCVISDLGDIEVPVRETLPREAAYHKYLNEIVQLSDAIRLRVLSALHMQCIPIVLGGDHSAVIGSIAGVAEHYRQVEAPLGLIWIDAHADMNTPVSSPSGNIHGMPLAVLLGQGHESLASLGGFKPKIRPDKCALIGIRDIDGDEKEICKTSGIRYITMREIDERGMHTVMKEAIALASDGTAGIHLSVDLDAIDPVHAPGVSTPVTGGLSYREAHLALEMIADTGKLSSIDMVELNPMTDSKHTTAGLAVELILSALGKSIV